MDDNGHRENGRHIPEMFRAPQSQWLMQQQPQSMKHIMSIMAERDAAIQERNMAVNEKKKASEERDLAIMQRYAAIQERDNAIIERDNAMSALQSRRFSISNNISSCPPDRQIPPTPAPSDSPKPRKVKRGETGQTSPNKKPTKSKHRAKKGEDLNEWKESHDMDYSDGSDLRSNRVAFDESTMAPPVCSCTGVYRQCYKWGNGGWQSACCTTTMSMYPLPAVPNKRRGRVGGRKMSGSVFSKLLRRLCADGYDLSNPVDLKDHWAKHGTNRYITIK